MNDPERLVVDSASDVERVLLRAGRGAVPSGAKERAFVVACGALPAPGLPAGVFAAAGAAAGSRTAGHLATFKFAGAVALAGGVMAVAATLADRHRAPPIATETSALPAPFVPAPPGSDATEASNRDPKAAPDLQASPSALHTAPVVAVPPAPPVVRAPRAAEARRTKVAVSAPDDASTLSTQIAMLDEARGALSDAKPARALSILDDYARRFPGGVMGPEASMLRIEALVRSGDRAAAVRLADTLRAGDPHGPYSARLQSLLETPKD